MPRVTVTKVDKSTKGKDRVYFDNLHNWQNAFYVGQDCGPPPAVGMVIEADTSSMRYQNAKADTWFLNRYSVVQGPITAGAANGAVNSPQAAGNPPLAPVKAPAVSGWPDLPTGDMLRWVSNVVGSAIAADRIESPQEMAAWVAAAYRAAEGLRSGKVEDFDDAPPDLSGLPPEEPQGGYDETDDDIPF
jgi:hypothetical protein